jgi:glucose/arabinose dehydrogenase
MMNSIAHLIRTTGSAVVGAAIAACSLTPSTMTPTQPNSSAEASPAQVSSASETVQGVRKTTVIDGLERPWSVAWLPDGSMLITEKAGRLRSVRKGVLDPTPISGVPEVLTVGQAGLLDVSIHPKFANNRLVYLTYSHGTSEANRTRVARATFDGKALRDLRVIFEVAQTKSDGQHFGSRILWLPDGTMLVAIGDGGNPPVQLNGDLIRKQAQNLRSHLGKIVRLNDDGSAPRDNPLATKASADPVIWSYGHRNIQGLAFDPGKQRVWATEHGSRGGDELNLAEVGKNYGWPIVTHSKEYTGGEISQERSRSGMVDPKVVWTPAIAPSGLAFYSSDRVPAWKGDLFAGGLVSQDVRRIDLDEAGNVRGQQNIPIGQRVRDVRQGPDGLLYVLTDDSNGQLIRLEPSGR